MSITSILAGYSAINILTTPGNINLPSGAIQTNIDLYAYSKTGVQNFYVYIPFDYTNAGYFELTDLAIEVTLKIEYIDSDTQEPKTIIFFNRKDAYPNVKRGEKYEGWYNIDEDDFNYNAIPENLFSKIDTNRDPLIDVLADVHLSGEYGIGLYAFEARLLDLNIASTTTSDLPQGAFEDLLTAGQVL